MAGRLGPHREEREMSCGSRDRVDEVRSGSSYADPRHRPPVQFCRLVATADDAGATLSNLTAIKLEQASESLATLDAVAENLMRADGVRGTGVIFPKYD